MVAVALLVTAQAGETAVAGMRVAQPEPRHRSWSPRLGGQERAVADAVAAADDWPRSRTDPGEDPGRND
ncbi:hypothetical protein A8713_03195 [Streptomyces sp. SAT1]|nr:hypothetical protein A8713_03195 [Streptomyces sp. SAT1]